MGAQLRGGGSEGDARSALTWGNGELYRNGVPHRMFSGSMQYFRVHPDQWRDRLERLAALGLNTVDTYVAWNFHERSEGDRDFTGWRDLEAYIRTAGEVGLDVFLRPSPYICAEWSNGGLPHWLTGRVADLRTSDPAFLAAIDAWYDELIPRIAPLQAAHGGPIVAIQVENEYGSYGSDRAYLEYLRDGLRSRGIVELLTTADGTTADMQQHGSVEGAMPTFTFGSGVERAVALQKDGVPFVCSEMWGGWFDHWGENHHARSAESMMGTIDEILEIGGSFSLYMAHGGTNFGFWNGANHDRVIQPTVTSYDYDAPIGEDGTLNDKFTALRAALEPFHDGPLPEVPAAPRRLPAATVPLAAATSLLDHVRATPEHPMGVSPRPRTFEELGAEDGFVAYEAVVSYPAGSTLTIDGLHDRATVFIGDARVGVLDRDGETTLELSGEGDGVRLTLLIESVGRINYGPFTGEGKGIMRGVWIGRRHVHGWTHRVLSQEAPGSDRAVAGGVDTAGVSAAAATSAAHTFADGGVFTATLDVTEPLDGWIGVTGGVKGLVWINGFLLGRYWERGPQETLYVPAPVWRAGANDIVVLDVHGSPTAIEVCDEPAFGPREEFIGV